MPKPQRLAYALSAIFTVTACLPTPKSAQAACAARGRQERCHVIMAEDISGRPEREVTLERDAELVKDKTRVKADTACYRQVEDEVEAKGNVKIWRFGDYFTGDELKLNMDTGKGYMLNPTYQAGSQPRARQGRAPQLHQRR
jgi:LPS-assembly protein